MINDAELQVYCSLMIVNGFVQTIVSKYLIIGIYIVIIIILSQTNDFWWPCLSGTALKSVEEELKIKKNL